MTAPILYSFRRCPYAMRARMALYYAGITVELREVDLKNKPAALLETSPKGTVPVLQLTDGTIIDESLDIIHWAVSQHDPNNWLKADKAFSAEAHTDMNDLFIPLVRAYKYPERYPEQSQADTLARATEWFTDLNARLVKNSGYYAGAFLSKSDVIIFPFIRQFRLVDEMVFDTLPLPALHRWISEFYRSDIYTKIMEKYTPWQPKDAPIYLES